MMDQPTWNRALNGVIGSRQAAGVTGWPRFWVCDSLNVVPLRGASPSNRFFIKGPSSAFRVLFLFFRGWLSALMVADARAVRYVSSRLRSYLSSASFTHLLRPQYVAG